MVVRRLVVVTPACCATTATSHPFTRAQVSTTPPWPGGSGHTLAIMLIVIHKYKCVPLYSLHRSAQDVVTSSSVWCGELRPAWPRGHCHHIFEHFNHSYPTQPSPPPPAFSMLQIFTADPSLSSCSCWPEYPVSKLSNSLAIY